MAVAMEAVAEPVGFYGNSQNIHNLGVTAGCMQNFNKIEAAAGDLALVPCVAEANKGVV